MNFSNSFSELFDMIEGYNEHNFGIISVSSFDIRKNCLPVFRFEQLFQPFEPE